MIMFYGLSPSDRKTITSTWPHAIGSHKSQSPLLMGWELLPHHHHSSGSLWTKQRKSGRIRPTSTKRKRPTSLSSEHSTIIKHQPALSSTCSSSDGLLFRSDLKFQFHPSCKQATIDALIATTLQSRSTNNTNNSKHHRLLSTNHRAL